MWPRGRPSDVQTAQMVAGVGSLWTSVHVILPRRSGFKVDHPHVTLFWEKKKDTPQGRYGQVEFVCFTMLNLPGKLMEADSLSLGR